MKRVKRGTIPQRKPKVFWENPIKSRENQNGFPSWFMVWGVLACYDGKMAAGMEAKKLMKGFQCEALLYLFENESRNFYPLFSIIPPA